MNNTLAGSCLCGAFRYSLSGEPLYAAYCYCSQCRKFSGSAFAAIAGFPAAALEVNTGADGPYLGAFAKTEETTLYFCRRCGSSLYAAKKSKGVVHVRLGAIDTPTARFQAEAHVHVGSKPSWYDIPADGLPRFEEAAPVPKRGKAGQALPA